MKQEQYQKSSKSGETKKLFFAAMISVAVTLALGISVLVYFFAPRKADRYAVTVPDFIGRSLRDTDRYENIEIVTKWVNSEDIPEGIVISQEPYANARRKIARGERCIVTLTVSLGEEREMLPDVISMPYLSAAAELRSLGARVRTVSIYSDGEDGLVKDVFPSVGSALCEGDLVTLFITRKRNEKSICVPNFCGMSLCDAAELALKLGLLVEDGGIMWNRDDTVITQSIPSGCYVKKGSYISFGK